MPRPIVGRVAKRYVAGETEEEALAAVGGLNDQGFAVTLALLGEEVAEEARAEAAVAEYEAGHARSGRERSRRQHSIKLTLLGLKIDEAYCARNLDRLIEAAAATDHFVRIDMEDHTCTDATLRLYQEHRGPHVGLVLQSYLKRTLDDAALLCAPEGAPPVNARLCKGIYIEPPDIAWQDDETIRLNFLAALEQLLSRGAYVGIATHDEYLVAGAIGIIRRLGLGPERYEFQTLLGCRRAAARLAARSRTSGARLRPLRSRLVRLLGAPAAREPADRHLRPARAARAPLTAGPVGWE